MVKHFNKMGYVLAALLAGLESVPALAQNCEVKLGAVGPMSGGASAWGLAMKAGADFAAAAANEDGGLPMGARKCQVKVVSFDSLYTASGGAAASNFLASESTKITMGPVGAPELAGYRPVAKRHGQVSFTTSYLADVIGPEFPLVFHSIQSPVTWGPHLIKAAADQFKFKTVFVVGANDQGGTDGSKAFAKIYNSLNIKAVEEYYQRGTTNFAPIAQRILVSKPEAVEMGTMPPQDTAILVKALVEAGFNGVIGALGGAGLPPIAQGAGGVDKIKGAYWLEVSPLDHPGVLKMKADYLRIMKSPAPENPLFAPFAVSAEVLLKAVSTAGTDQDAEKVADVLRKTTPDSRYMGKAGWRGKTIYGVNQELSFPVGLGMVVEGKKLPVRTVEIPSEQ